MDQTSLKQGAGQGCGAKEPRRRDFFGSACEPAKDNIPGSEHPYALLASGIAGRRIGIVYMPEKKISAYTDGEYIYLSSDSHDMDQRAVVMVQAALLANRSLEKGAVRKLVGRSRAAKRFLYLEVLRAIRSLRQQLPRRLTDHDAFVSSQALSHSVEESLKIAFSRQSLPECPEFFGDIRPIQILKTSLAELGRPSERDLKGNFKDLDLEDLDDDDAEEVKFLKLFSNPLFSGGFLADLLRKILGMGTSPGDKKDQEEAGGGGAEMPMGRKESFLMRGFHAMLSMIPVEIPSGVLAREAGGTSYPEWDAFKECYLPDWTSVQEYDSWHTDEPCELGIRMQPPASALRRSLSRIGLGHERHRHQPQGDHFSIDGAVRLVVDRRMGHTPDERIYCDTRKTRRDLGVLVLLDMSGSADEASFDGRSVFELQAKAACQIIRVLDELGDQVALYSFYSWGRNLVRLLRIKAFTDRMDSRVFDRFSNLKPMGYTRLGAAIRHSTTIINHSSGTPHRLLIVITDGFPYDEGYEGAYGEADARRAIEEARAAGVGVICINIGAHTHEKQLLNVFGSSCHMSLSVAEHMNNRLGELFVNAIGEVMWRKRGAGMSAFMKRKKEIGK